MSREHTRGLDLYVTLGSRGLRAGLEQDLREAVRLGRLKPGTPLPSSRVLAADLGVSRNTVANAYAQLVAEGWLEARQGRGTSVARDLPGAALSADRDGTQAPKPRYDLRPGVPDVAGFPRDAWAAAYRRALLAAPAETFAYGDPLGHPRLRATLAAYLGRARGVRTTGAQIVICNGATHGLSMLAAALVHTGHATVAMESHCFPRFEQAATHQGLTVTALPLDQEGACVTGLWGGAATAVVLTPSHQFPTGVPLSAQLADALSMRSRPLALRGVAAGLHCLIELPGGHPMEMDVLAAAGRHGLALAGLSEFRIAGNPGTELGPDRDRAAAPPGGLVIGYARPPGHAFHGALAALLDVLPG